jgi:hypothetical protein
LLKANLRPPLSDWNQKVDTFQDCSGQAGDGGDTVSEKAMNWQQEHWLSPKFYFSPISAIRMVGKVRKSE